MGDDEKKFTDVFKSLGKYAEVVGSAFLSNFRTTDISKQIQEYENKAIAATKAFGLGRDNIVELKKSMADAVVSVTQLGGGLDDVATLALDVGKALNRNITLTSDSYAKLYATAQVTGVQNATLINGFKDAGFSVYQVSQNMQKVVDTARESGINVKTVSSEVMSNMGLMDKYNFAGGVEGLAKMATQATNLRITVKDIQNTMSKTFEPESAIEMAAALQRLGMAQSDLLDPLRLMDLAQNDPAELQNQMAEMSKTFVEFNEKTKSFQIAPGAKRQLQEVAQALGMQPEAFAKMAKSAAEMDDKLKKISFPDTFTEEQRKFVANMAEMGEGGEYMLRLDGKDMGIDKAMKLFQEQPETYKKFLEDSKPKSMEDIAKGQLTVSESVLANVKSIANRVGAAVASSDTQEMANKANIELSQVIPKLVSGERLQIPTIRETGDKIGQDLLEGIKKGDLVGSLTKAESEGKKWSDAALGDVISGANTALSDLGKSTNPLIGVMTTLATKTGEFVAKQEGLEKEFTTLTETVKATNNNLKTSTETTAAKKEIEKVVEIPKTGANSSGEINFSKPLKMELSVTGLQSPAEEQMLLNWIKGGKLDQALVEAIKRGEIELVKK